MAIFSRKPKENTIILGEGYRVNDKTRKPALIRLPDSSRRGHFWCFGTTRVGKTKLLSNLVEQDIDAGKSVIVIDPKGDFDLMNSVVERYLKFKDEYDFVFIIPVFPEFSDTINPLADYYMPEELVGHIVSGVDVGKEAFFFNVAYEISLVIVQSMLMLDKKGFTLLDVKNYISKDALTKLKLEVEATEKEGCKQLGSDIQKILDSPTDYYSKISSSLRVSLTELTSGNIGKIVGQTKENRFIKRLESGKKLIMLVQTGSMLTRKASFTLSKVIVSMIHSFAGRMFASNKKIKNGLSLYIDEAQSVLYSGIEDLLAKAGGANIFVHGFCQSINQIYAGIGKDRGKSILDNTNTKLFFRVPDSDTAKYVSNYFGTFTNSTPILSSGGGFTTRTKEDYYVKPEKLLDLKERVFYLITYSGKYKAITLDSKKPKIEIQLPDVHTANLQNTENLQK